jgi:threonine dehydratase
VGEETFRLCQEYVDEMILVDNDAICAAIKDVFEDTRSILEPPARWPWPAPRNTPSATT